MISAIVVEDTGTRTETIGERLKRLRHEQGFSQRDLSAPGISYAYISRIEAGARRPSVKALRLLAQKLGVNTEYLETGSEIDAAEQRELGLAELELRLRLDGEAPIAALHELLDDAIAHADSSGATRARIALGFAAAAAGKHSDAVVHLELVAGSGLVTPATRPDVYSTLGRSYAAGGAPKKAVELFESGLEQLSETAPEDLAARVRFSTYLSYALTDLGELQRAKAVVAEVFTSSEQVTDRYTRVRVLWSLGRISLEQAKPQAALDNFRRAVALLEATEDTVHLARAHIACADATIASGDDCVDAERHLAEAERLLEPHPDRDDLAAIRVLQATCATRSESFVEAERLGQEALLLTLELPMEAGNAWWAIAEARAGAGDPTAADAFRQAVELLGAHGTVRHHATVLRSYGRYLRSNGRESEALDVLEQAADVAANLQGEPSTAER
jgi:transcriptional regulator with XRE-family HTH domain